MKYLLIVLAAGVVVGLSVYSAFSVSGAFGVLGDRVVMQIDVLVWLIACLTIAAASVALLFRAAVARADRTLVRHLEERLARLEQRGGGAS